MSKLVCNSFGLAKAQKFRARFGLGLFSGCDVDYVNVHDYLHTVIGALPVLSAELDVLSLETAVETGAIALPRGLTFA